MTYCEIVGLDEVIAELERRVLDADKKIDTILKQSGKMFADEMKANVPKSDINHKHLKDAIGVSKVMTDDIGGKYVTVGTSLGNGKHRHGVYWGHFVEGGHNIVVNGKNKGFVEGKPFVQPAFNKIKGKAYKFIKDEFYKALNV